MEPLPFPPPPTENTATLCDLLYILSPGHSGSTLLNICLDRHSQLMGVSEIHTLNLNRPGWSGDEDALASPFWSEVDRVMRRCSHGPLSEVPFNLRSVASSDLPSAISLNHAALEVELSVAKKKITVDASKEPRRLAALLASPLFRVRVIYLVRDGRAVVHAYRRKYGYWFVGWLRLMRTEWAARSLMAECESDGAWLTVRYEDMATDLEATMRRICDFAGVHFEPEMLLPDTSAFNGLGGNRLRKRSIQSITLDTGWMTEMPKLVRAFTTLAVGVFNRRYGYRD